jgi:3',5'-cyclic AMP phosphodiesterase CpdA
VPAPDFRLIHVSDLHFGDSLFTPWWVVSTWIPGLETHSTRVAQELSNSLRLLTSGTNQVSNAVVATGDLTTWGRPSAFSLANTYLRGRHYVGGHQTWMGLNAVNAAVVPGNHDIWSGAILGLSFGAATPPSTRPDFDQFFNPPAPTGSYPIGTARFPYRLRFNCSHVAIFLYGLDSTRVDLLPHPRSHNFRADGFVDPQQLKDLEALVTLEPEPHIPRVRIAAIHHPIGYPQSTVTSTWKTLVNLDTEVIPALQQLDFAIALCGHEHRGFVRSTSAPNTLRRSIFVFSAGTGTQTVRLSATEKRILGRLPSSLSSHERTYRAATVEKCNEFRIYDFTIDPQDLKALKVTVRHYWFDPNLFAFVEAPSLVLPISI